MEDVPGNPKALQVKTFGDCLNQPYYGLDAQQHCHRTEGKKTAWTK